MSFRSQPSSRLAHVLTISLVISTGLTAFGAWVGIPAGENVFWQTVNLMLSVVSLSAIFALLFKYFPDAPVAWRDVWPGSIATAVLFEAGKFAISLYIAKQGLELTYGAAASFVVLLVWVYYSSQIMLFGAELTHVYALRRKVAGRARMPSAVSPLPEERAVTCGHPLPRGSGTEQRPVAPRSLAGADMLDENDGRQGC